jgi:hypothetical protein
MKVRLGWRATALINLEKAPGSRCSAFLGRRGALKTKS